MCSITNWDVVCDTEQSLLLSPGSFCAEAKDGTAAPFDELLSYAASVVRLGTSENLERSDVLGRVLLLGLVSGTEMYFRSLLSGLVAVCPIARRYAADLTVTLGAVDFYKADRLGYALMEHVSLASEGELRRTTKKIACIEWNPKSSVAIAIEQFEALSHLRHVAVHARGEMGVRNMKALGLASENPLSVVVRFSQLQEAAAICLNASRAYNRFLFRETIERWIGERILSGEWKLDRNQFGRLFALFRCRSEGYGGAKLCRVVYEQVTNCVRAPIAQR